MTTYHGIVNGLTAMNHEVWVVRGRGEPQRLDARLGVRNHSPTGLSWGYAGSGPAQTSLALLCDVIGIRRALPIYQTFKLRHITTLSQWSDWTMTEAEIHQMAETIETENEPDTETENRN